MQILVFVVLAVVYALGSILKARADKAEQEKGQEEELAHKRPRKPPAASRGIQRQPVTQPRRRVGPVLPGGPEPQVQPVRRQVRRPQAAVEKPVTEKQPTPGRPFEMPELVELPRKSPQLEPSIEELPEFTSETLEKMKAKPLGLEAKAPAVEDVSEPVLDSADTDELRRAILHYEILGKPLSLRAPSEKIIGL